MNLHAYDFHLLKFESQLRRLLVGKEFDDLGRLESLADRSLEASPCQRRKTDAIKR
jgi:hypothetical protein